MHTCQPRRQLFACLLAWFVGLSFIPSNTGFSASTMNAVATDRTLTIVGASYAAGLREPKVPGFVVTNKGVAGEQSSELLARFERDVVAHSPDAVLIWGHINDLFRSPNDRRKQASMKVRENFRAMHEKARAAGIQVLFATEVTITVSDSWIDELRDLIGTILGRENYQANINRHVREVNEWMRGYADEQNLILLDFEKAVDSGNGSRRADFSDPDGSHISPAGYEALTRYMIGALTKAAPTG